MLEVFFKSFLFIPLVLLLWLIGLTLIPSGIYFIRTGRSVSAKAKPPARAEKGRRSARRLEKSDYDVTVETGQAVRQKGLLLIGAGGICLVAFGILFVLFLATTTYPAAGLVALMVGLAALALVARYFVTPPKSSS